MTTYKAVEVSEPGKLRVVERPIAEPGRDRCGFAWKRAESAIPTRQRLWEFTLALRYLEFPDMRSLAA